MADILIRMEMPKNCARCDFSSVVPGEVWCKRAKEIVPEEQAVDVNRHPAFCPLHELPPHGDLIDRDALLKRSPDHWDEEYIEGDDEYVYRYYLDSTIENTPVVVPADKEAIDAD